MNDIGRNLSFVLRRRGSCCSLSESNAADQRNANTSDKASSDYKQSLYTIGNAGIVVVCEHQFVLCGTRLFLDGEEFERDVAYLSKCGNLVVITKEREILLIDFEEGTRRRISVASCPGLLRCEADGDSVGVLWRNGALKIFEKNTCVLEKSYVIDFLLPNSILQKNGDFCGLKNVLRIFRHPNGDEIGVNEKRIETRIGGVDNPLHKGDFEYDRKDDRVCYYFATVNEELCVIASSNSSLFVLLGREMKEIELDEEINVLGLRNDDSFNVRYLRGMDYSDGVMYLLDEDGVVSMFDVRGLGLNESVKRLEVPIIEENYVIVDNLIEKIASNILENPSTTNDEIHSRSSNHSKLDTLSSNSSNVASRDHTSSRPSIATCNSQRKASSHQKLETSPCDYSQRGYSRPDHLKAQYPPGRAGELLERLVQQTEDVICGFGEVRVSERRFRMYRYEGNDLPAQMEQVYRNMMKLNGHRDLEKEIVEKLTTMLGYLEMQKGMDEENVKSAVKYIDAAIERSVNTMRKIVHYKKPLFCRTEKIYGPDSKVDFKEVNGGEETRKKMFQVLEQQEKNLEEPCLEEDLTHLEIGGKDGEEEKRRGEVMEKNGEEEIEKTMEMNEPDVYVQREEIHVPEPIYQGMNIFGQPMSTERIQFDGGQNASNIFQTITSEGFGTLEQRAGTEEEGRREARTMEEKSSSIPNAFSRFAGSRNLFR